MRGLLLALALLLPLGAGANASAQTQLPQRELVVGTKDTPPFAMKSPDGEWSGISIELWRRVAAESKLNFRFTEEQNVSDLIEGVAAGRFDVAIGALTVTAPRERVLDFTSSFYSTGLGIAIPSSRDPSWWPVVRALTSFGFMQAVAALIGLALAVGVLVWALERRHNEDFGGSITKGLSSGVWWTTTTMTQRGASHFGPRTLPGRAVAMFWMVGSIIAIAVFTAGITSALTVRQLQGSVQGVNDLASARVGVVAGTSTEDSLLRFRISFERFANPREGLQALRRGRIDAFVYDKPLLAWNVNQSFRSSLQVLDTSFEPQNYAFALQSNSSLRKPLSVAILDSMQSEWWEQTLFRYLGYR